jgi:hypothetical protein
MIGPAKPDGENQGRTLFSFLRTMFVSVPKPKTINIFEGTELLCARPETNKATTEEW